MPSLPSLSLAAIFLTLSLAACAGMGEPPPEAVDDHRDGSASAEPDGGSVHPARIDGGPGDSPSDGGTAEMKDGGPPGASDGGPATTAGDTCASPIPLDPSAGPVTVTGTTVGAAHDYDGPPACAISSSALDVVYSIQVQGGNTLRATYTGSGSNVCLSTQSACPDSSLIGGCTCGDPTTGLTREKAYEDPTEAFLFVWAAEPGSTFELEVEVVPTP